MKLCVLEFNILIQRLVVAKGRITFCLGFIKIMLKLRLRNSWIKGVLNSYNAALTTCHLIKMTACPLEQCVGTCLVST